MALDINSATIEELAEVPGMTSELAADIILYRDENGGFASMDDLRDVDGCTEEMVLRLQQEGVMAGAGAGTEGSQM